MIRSHTALLRIAQDFFLSDLVGFYRWPEVKLGEPELRPSVPSTLSYRDRRAAMEAREGRGKYLEQERLIFGPWEILIYSSVERGPLGEVILRDALDIRSPELVSGPLDPATWSRIGQFIRSQHQRKAS